MAEQGAELFGDAQALVHFQFGHGAWAFALVGIGEAQAVVFGPADGCDSRHQGDHRQRAKGERVDGVVSQVEFGIRATQAEEPGDQRGGDNGVRFTYQVSRRQFNDWQPRLKLIHP